MTFDHFTETLLVPSVLVALLGVVVRIAWWMGSMVSTVHSGFKANADDHATIMEYDKEQHAVLGGKIDAQGRKIDAAVVRIDDLHHSVGVLQGKAEKRNGV